MKRILLLLVFALPMWTLGADTTRLCWMGHSLLGSGDNGRITEFAAWSAQYGLPFYQKQLRYTTAKETLYNYEIMQSWKATYCKDSIKTGRYDAVIYNVLYKTYLAADSFYKYQKLYVDLIDSLGAKPIIYDDWHQPSTPFALKVCRDNGAYIAPVQTAYLWVSARYPDIHYKVDWAHAAQPLGYLAGCVSWSTLTGMKPYGLAKVYAALDAEEAHLMRQAAWNAIVDTPYINFQPWPSIPPLVRNVAFSKDPDTIRQFESRQLLVRATFTNDSTEPAANNAIFSSLTPDIVSVSHSGKIMARQQGTGRVLAIREKRADTLSLLVGPTTLTLDSVRIFPRTVVGFLGNGYQFHANGYFRDGASPLIIDVTANVSWKSSDSTVFTAIKGLIQRTSARGGAQYVAVEMSGKRDTVRFTMIPEFQYLARIKFLDKDTVLNANWKTDNAKRYSDTLGFGWLETADVPYYVKRTDWQAIQYRDSNFLRQGYVAPANRLNQAVWGTFKFNCLDGDYIIKMVVGSYYQYTQPCTVATMNGTAWDTLVKFMPTVSTKLKTIKDTIRVFGMDGFKLRIYGPIEYIVVCSKEGVDIDSVAFDSDAFIRAEREAALPALGSIPSLLVFPNPFTRTAALSFEPGSSGPASLLIFDAAGRCVFSAVSDRCPAGPQQVNWDGRDPKGRPVASGVYVARLYAGGGVVTQRLVLSR